MSISLIHAAVTGEYETPADITQLGADCLAGQSFGYRINQETGEKTPGPINESLGRIAVETASLLGVPTIMQWEIADVMADLGHPVDKKIETHRDVSKYLDTEEVLRQTKDYMEKEGLMSAIFIAHAYHIGRVAAQAAKIGINGFPAPGLPTNFDPESAQRWIRSRRLWVLREIPTLAVFKLQGKI